MPRSTAKLEGVRVGDGAVVEQGGLPPPLSPDRQASLHLVPTCNTHARTFAAEIRFPPEGLVDIVWRVQLADGSERFFELPRVGRNRHAGLLSLSCAPTAITLEMRGSADPLAYTLIAFRPLSQLKRALSLGQRAARVISREIQHLLGRRRSEDPKSFQADYEVWRERFDERPEIDRALHKERSAAIGKGPKLSLIMGGADPDRCAKTVASLAAQIYTRWELVLLAQPGQVEAIEDRIAGSPAKDRIVIIPAGGDPAGSWNEGLARISGAVTAVIPAGATLPSHALTEVAIMVATNPHLELLYTDEDRRGRNGVRFAPLFKPEWSPDFLRARDYLGHLTFFRTETLRRLGGWQPLAGREHHDAKLRVADAASATPNAVLHLAKVLIHLEDGSAADTRSEQGSVEAAASPPARTRSLDGGAQPLVSIIIPTRDQSATLNTCVQSILEQTTYAPFEILIVDNGSTEHETARLFEKLSRDDRITVLRFPDPFNYSAINNFAVRHARGSLLAFLNNDVEVLSPGWLSEMAAHAVRPELGCIGAKLLYPDRTVQHGGVLLGVAGVAGHAHRNAPETAQGYLGRLASVVNVSAVTGACLVVRRQLFDEMGGFDEVGLATAFNDIDLCLKVRTAGYANLWTPDAVLIHHESKSRGYERTPAKRARLAREEDVMRRRWGRLLLNDPYYSRHLTREGEGFRPRRR